MAEISPKLANLAVKFVKFEVLQNLKIKVLFLVFMSIEFVLQVWSNLAKWA